MVGVGLVGLLLRGGLRRELIDDDSRTIRDSCMDWVEEVYSKWRWEGSDTIRLATTAASFFML